MDYSSTNSSDNSSFYQVDIEELTQLAKTYRTIKNDIEETMDSFFKKIEYLCGEGRLIEGNFALNISRINDKTKFLLNDHLNQSISDVVSGIGGFNSLSNNGYCNHIEESDHCKGV